MAAIIAATIGGQLFAHEFRRAKTFEDVWAGSCTVSVPNALGTGQFNGVDRDENKAVITTNYHVVTTNKTATLYFLTNGKMESVQGEIRRKAYDEGMPVDVAQIYVDVDALAKIDPPFLPYAGRGSAPTVGDVIASSGCPRGTFPKAWHGTILNYYNGKTAVFTPAPEPGQSGSAIVSIYEDDLPYQTGILTWLFTNSKTGGAIPIKNVYAAFEGRRATSETGDAFPQDATLCMSDEEDPTQALIGAENRPTTSEYKWHAPLVEDRADVSFLDDNDAAWRNRRQQRPREEQTPEPKTTRPTQRIEAITPGALIDKTAQSMIDKVKSEIVKEVKRTAGPVLSVVLALAIVAGIVSNLLTALLFNIGECIGHKFDDEEENEQETKKTKTSKGEKK